MIKSLRNHWPEYLIEAWGLGMFMIAACVGTAILWHPDSPVEHWVGHSTVPNPMFDRRIGMP